MISISARTQFSKLARSSAPLNGCRLPAYLVVRRSCLMFCRASLIAACLHI